MTKGPIPTTLQLVDEKDMKVDGKTPTDKEGRLWVFRQLASYFTMVLTAYQNAMDAERQDTNASKQAYNTMVQTRENMKPVS
jgi:pre-mRNA-splicing factor 18